MVLLVDNIDAQSVLEPQFPRIQSSLARVASTLLNLKGLQRCHVKYTKSHVGLWPSFFWELLCEVMRVYCFHVRGLGEGGGLGVEFEVSDCLGLEVVSGKTGDGCWMK